MWSSQTYVGRTCHTPRLSDLLGNGKRKIVKARDRDDFKDTMFSRHNRVVTHMNSE